MKVSLIATLGTSPPVVTEFLRYMVEAERLNVTDLVVVTTADPVVQKGLELVRTAATYRYPKIHFHAYTLPYEDVSNNEENIEFMASFARILFQQREVHRVSAIYLSLAGGRKDMSITAALISQYFGVNGVYHIVMPNVKIVNERLEAARHLIDELYMSSDKLEFYKNNEEIFNALMYPPFSEYSVIKIPLIPYPVNILREIYKLLSSGKSELRLYRLPRNVVEGLVASGIIRITSKGTVYPLEDGLILCEVLKKAQIEKL